MRKKKVSTVWTVRNLQGQFIGTYWALTAEQAIGKAVRDDYRTASTFRKSQPATLRASDLTASVEPQD